MSEPTQEEWAILLPAYRALKAEWEAGRKPVVITSARYEALMAAATKAATALGNVIAAETGDEDWNEADEAIQALRAAGIETGEGK